MANYKITFKSTVKKDFKNIPAKNAKRIFRKINSLADNPSGHGCEKLSGQERYRARQGDYRIIYEIRDRTLVVHVVKVDHRSIVYE